MLSKLKHIKEWFVEAISNGGIVVVAAAVLLAGAAGHVAHDDVQRFISGAPSSPAAPAVVAPGSYQCPDETWTRTVGAAADIGASYTVCAKNKVVIRHFDSVQPGVEQTQAMDQGVYPFNDQISVQDAINLANSR